MSRGAVPSENQFKGNELFENKKESCSPSSAINNVERVSETLPKQE